MKTLLIYSGGMDSTTLLYKLRAEGGRVLCLSFDYGQRHRKELQSAQKICQRLKVPHKIVDITAVKNLMEGSALTSNRPSRSEAKQLMSPKGESLIKVPEGHYTSKRMKITVVPNRNMIFLALAIAQAISLKFDRVAMAVHAGDHAIYPDCRPAFIKGMRAVSKIANYNKIDIYTPFLHITKRKIAKIGHRLGVPYELTWTCYKGLKNPCGKCGACVERTEAFEK